MTDQERLMYQIIGKISDINAPIVFKGALITKLILSENGFTLSERPTSDIDANWVGEPPTMDELTDLVNRSLESFNGTMYAVTKRPYGPGKSAGIWILSKATDEQLVAMDITIKPVIGSRVYHYGEAAIHGVVQNAVLCDKISVLSGDRIFRRSKDVYDIYALANCLNICTTDIYAALEKAERELGAFEAFTTRRSDLEHAYNKMRGVIGKPAFDDVYSFLGRFLEPFITHDRSPRIWNCDTVSWQNLPSC